MSLQKKALSGISWTFVEQFGSQAIGFIVQIVLARLIAPEEFGLLGMILVFNAVGNSLSDSGMSQSLIRSDKPDEEDFSTVFSINFAVSVFLYLLFYFTAPFISEFYDQPRLTDLIRVYSIVIVINSLFIIQKTRLTYELNFKYQMKAQLPALFLSGLTGIVLAYLNFGVWALVYMRVVTGIALTVIYFFQTRWIPTIKINRVKLKEHFDFGYKVALSGIMSRVVSNIYPMIIGKYFSAAMVGYYTRALTMKDFPEITISNTLDKVVYPLFARIKNDNIQLKNAYQKIQILSLFVLSSVMLLLIITAEPLFGLLLGEEWLPAVPYFQILCIMGVFYPINKYNSNILKVKGRTDLYLKMTVWSNILLIIGIALTVKFGIIPLILSQVVVSLIRTLINIYYANKFIDYPLHEQFVDVFKTTLPGIISFALVFAFIYFNSTLDESLYVIQLIAYGASFSLILMLIHILFKTRSLKEIMSIYKLVRQKS
ncbi:lipopolysaccharide biosynthesis protein [Christiangramia sp. ASW11-125]|uniref:lipopolysaccharide biosynthesis protein n=1 Tax=Christiangramia sp. ASW11-125 TaxID=3400701 RepID=UPI003AADDEC7